MAAAAAASAGEPPSPDELLPKGDAEKTEEELEEDDDEDVLVPRGARGGERARPGVWAPRAAGSGQRRRRLREAGLGTPLGPGCPSSGGLGQLGQGWMPLPRP
jgi:hypothetical protein